MIELTAETTKPLFGAFSFVNLYIDFLHYLLYIRASNGDKGMNIEQIKKDAEILELKGPKYFAENIGKLAFTEKAFAAAYYFASVANFEKPIIAEHVNDLGFSVVFNNGFVISLSEIVEDLKKNNPSKLLMEYAAG